MIEAGDIVEVATEDRPDLVFDAAGTVVRVSASQGSATVEMADGTVEMFSLRRLRLAR